MYTRTHPFLSKIRERTLLSGPDSSKKMYHLVLDANGMTDACKVGDSIGILPSNDPDEVDQILHHVRAQGSESMIDPRSKESLSLREFLLYKANIAQGTRALLQNLKEKGTVFEEENTLLHSHTVWEIVRLSSIRGGDWAFTLMPLLPRFYSIANSQKMFPNEFHLLVKYVHYTEGGQVRRGIASHFLIDLANVLETPIPLYLQPSNHFTLPTDPNASLILVGPGTGVAPFRGFLQERLYRQDEGRSWLFFGERNRASDFYYESFWTDLVKEGRLRLDAVFSRDGGEKIYVQHKMYEHRKSLWEWIREGAFFYVCGDASKMAKDVDAMLCRIVKEEGAFSEKDADDYVKAMRKEKRYLVDVY